MNFYLPTRDECQALTKTSEAFYCSEKTIEGQTVEMYDYRLAGLKDFFPDDGKNWTELRGLTFVQQTDSTWERNILLQKFFNINQTEGWMYDDVIDKKITRIQNKEDGSIISFVKFTNGKVRAKSKMSFESEQAVMAQEIYNTNKYIKTFVDACFVNDIVPIFELVGPENQIVLEYYETDLILLQMRKTDGTYTSNRDMKILTRNCGVNVVEDIKIHNHTGLSTLETLLHLKETSQDNIEGWVVTFEDGQMAKIKTDHYLSLHGLIGPDAFRENLLVKTILDGNIDDVISALVPGVKRDKLIELSEKVEHHFNHLVVEFKELRDLYFTDFKEDRKAFAIAKRTERLFSLVMRTLHAQAYEEKSIEEVIKGYIEKQCKGLNDAKKYLNSL